MGQPAALLVVVLDNIPEAMCEIKLNRDKQPVVVYEVSLFVSCRCIYRCFEIFLGDVALSSSIKRNPRFEDFFCS